MGAQPTKAQIERAIAAAEARGIVVGAVEVRPDGTIRVEAASPVAPANKQPQDRRAPIPWT